MFSFYVKIVVEKLGKQHDQIMILCGRVGGLFMVILNELIRVLAYPLFILNQTTPLIHSAVLKLASVILPLYTFSTGLTTATNYKYIILIKTAKEL